MLVVSEIIRICLFITSGLNVDHSEFTTLRHIPVYIEYMFTLTHFLEINSISKQAL